MILRWTVRSDQIDLDRWAKAILRAIGEGAQKSGPELRWWTWPAIVLILLVLALSVGVGTIAVVFALPALVMVGLVVGLKLTGERRLATQLKRVPSAHEGFTCVADAIGTNRTGPGGSDQLPWSRYRAVRLDDDVITLLLDNNSVMVLPVAGLEGTEGPSAAVARITEWIEEAHVPLVLSKAAGLE